jgi:hypothetical protein
MWNFMLTLRHRFVVIVLLGVSIACHAYEIPKRSLEERIHAADVVAVGTIVSLVEADPQRPESIAVATVRLDSVLKGVSTTTIRLMYRGGISEADPVCCAVGERYFLMLARSDGDLYVSVNGPYGVINIDATIATEGDDFTWPGAREVNPKRQSTGDYGK